MSGEISLTFSSFVPAPPGCGFPTVAYYRFDNDGPGATEAATTVRDECLNHDGTAMNSPLYSSDIDENPVPQTGESNVLSLDFKRGAGASGTEHYIEVPADDWLGFGPSQPFTIESWVKLDTLGDACPVCQLSADPSLACVMGQPCVCSIIGGSCQADSECNTNPVCDTANEKGNSAYVAQKKGVIGGPDDFEMDYGFMAQLGNRGNGRNNDPANILCKAQNQLTGRELAYEFGDGISSFVTVVSPLEINDTNWHHVSMAFDGSDEVRFGVDGNFDTCTGLSAFGHTVNAGEMLIGAKTRAPGGTIHRRFDGLMDELRISEDFLAEDRLLLPEPGTTMQIGFGLAFLFLVGRKRMRH